MTYRIVDTGASQSFSDEHRLRQQASAEGDVLVILGSNPAAALVDASAMRSLRAVLIELKTECLGVYTGETRAEEGSNMLGFARFRLGDDAPSNQIELVRQPRTDHAALEAARELFTGAGLRLDEVDDVIEQGLQFRRTATGRDVLQRGERRGVRRRFGRGGGCRFIHEPQTQIAAGDQK